MDREQTQSVAAAWLRERWKVGAALAAVLAIYLAVYLLWHLPLEPALYAALLCAAGAAGLGIRDFLRFRARHRALREQLASVGLALDRLPEAQGLLERDYQELLRTLLEEKAALAGAADRQYGDMLDYYTLWVHQIKTPIAAMHLLLQEDPGNRDELAQELFKIERYADMVLQYLRLAGMSSDLVLERCPLDEVVRQAVKKYAPVFIRRRVALHWTPTGTTVLTDEKWLVFVLEQLLSNALKYTPPGGAVSLYLEPGAVCTLAVEDTGIGIRAEDLPRLYEKGFTGLNGRLDKKATGLGLYLVRQVTDKLGHGVTITSQPGKGTVVHLDLARERRLFD